MLFETFNEQRGPLAARMRPKSLQDVLGQSHLLSEGMPLRRLIDGDSSASSVILYGPPGTGKTTLAQMIANSKKRKFVELSATSAGVKEVREVIDRARFDLGASGEESVLFIDEFHRFSKAQQDALLPAVENGFVILVAATTENPSFSIIGPLLSRSLLVTLRAHTNEDLNALIDRAIQSKNGLTADGIVGEVTWNKLMGTTPAVAAPTPVVVSTPIANTTGLKLDSLKGHVPDNVIGMIPEVASKFEINTPLRLAHFLAQCGHESGGFKLTQENLNYSADGLIEAFVGDKVLGVQWHPERVEIKDDKRDNESIELPVQWLKQQFKNLLLGRFSWFVMHLTLLYVFALLNHPLKHSYH